METIEKINKFSPNYDKIVNYLYEENDLISKLLIDYYQDYINNIKGSGSINSIDNALNEYILKKEFYKEVQIYFDLGNNFIFEGYNSVMKKLLNLYKKFEEERFKSIKNTRWL